LRIPLYIYKPFLNTNSFKLLTLSVVVATILASDVVALVAAAVAEIRAR